MCCAAAKCGKGHVAAFRNLERCSAHRCAKVSRFTAGYGAKRLIWDDLHSIRFAIPVALLLALPGPARASPDIELGRHHASLCMTCHRTATSAGSAIPNIFGMPEARMITLLKAYRDKQLPNPVMQGIAFGFKDDRHRGGRGLFRTHQEDHNIKGGDQ